MRSNYYKRKFSKIIAGALTICCLFASGCSAKSPIGEIVLQAPITALMFESQNNNGDNAQGVVYRKVNDINLLLAQQDLPILIVFLDGRATSNSAIPFTEELCDRFSKSAQIVRVNVEIGDQTPEIQSLITLFQVNSYPWFALCYKGQRKNAISGYDTSLENDIISMIENVKN